MLSSYIFALQVLVATVVSETTLVSSSANSTAVISDTATSFPSIEIQSSSHSQTLNVTTSGTAYVPAGVETTLTSTNSSSVSTVSTTNDSKSKSTSTSSTSYASYISGSIVSNFASTSISSTTKHSNAAIVLDLSSGNFIVAAAAAVGIVAVGASIL